MAGVRDARAFAAGLIASHCAFRAAYRMGLERLRLYHGNALAAAARIPTRNFPEISMLSRATIFASITEWN
jgi:hypothetical protein